MRSIVAQNPFAKRDLNTLHVLLLERVAEQEKIKVLIDLLENGEEFKFIGRVCYFYAPNGIGRSKWASQFEKICKYLPLLET